MSEIRAVVPAAPDASGRRWPRVPALALAAAAALFAMTITTADAAPDPVVINACFSTTTGVVRVVAPGTPCGPKEFAFTWNQQGPAGPAGPAGPSGPQGPAGPAGSGGGSSIIGGGSDVLPTSAISYIGLFEGRSSATEPVVAQRMPAAGTVSNLYADSEVDPGTFICIGATCQDNSWFLQLMKNGSPTGLSCTVRGSTIYHARIPCTNTTASVSYAAGDTLSLQVNPGSIPAQPASAFHWTASFTSS